MNRTILDSCEHEHGIDVQDMTGNSAVSGVGPFSSGKFLMCMLTTNQVICSQ